MNSVIEIDEYGIKHITEDDDILTCVTNSLARNNTFFPNIDKIKIQDIDTHVVVMDENGKPKKDDKGKVIKEKCKQRQMMVRYADGSWNTVRLNPNDKNDPMVALLYAMVKRLFGVPNDRGYVNGSQFMNKLNNMIKNAETPEKLEDEKAKRAKEKSEHDKAEHDAAEKRKEENPSLHSCVAKQNKILEQMNELLSKLLNK